MFQLGVSYYPGYRFTLQYGPMKPAVRVIPPDQVCFGIALVS